MVNHQRKRDSALMLFLVAISFIVQKVFVTSKKNGTFAGGIEEAEIVGTTESTETTGAAGRQSS